MNQDRTGPDSSLPDMTQPKDTLFAKPRTHLVDFAFDEQVASVFPDMIRRSVPGYETVIAMLGVFASQYVTDNSRVYDLGCSQGAATLAIRHHIHAAGVTMIAVDNAQAMIDRCQSNLAADLSTTEVQLRCEHIQDTEIHRASLVSLNYTLQFIPLAERQALIERIYDGLQPGGALVLSEKIACDPQQQQRMTDWHHEFKHLNGYSHLEISQKRQAIENVLVPETDDAHQQRLKQAGFQTVDRWFQCFNFASYLAVK